MQASKACRDWVLRSAPKASLRPDLVAAEPHAWLRQLAWLRECVEARGPALPLALGIARGGKAGANAPLALICEHLGPACSGATEFAYCDMGPDEDLQAGTHFLESIAAAMPKLRQLTLFSCVPLPQPQVLPSLTECVIYLGNGEQEEAVAELCSSMGACITQLTSLELNNGVSSALPFKVLIPSITHTLTHLNTSNPLDDDLLGLLLDRAPELTHLSVHGCELSQSRQNKQWKVTSLELLYVQQQDMEHVARLPKCSAGTVRLTVKAKKFKCCVQSADQGLPPEVWQRLSDFHFSASSVTILLGEGAGDIGTMERALTQARDLHAPETAVELFSDTWTAAGLHVVRTALPTITHLQIRVLCSYLGSSIMPALLSLGPHLHSVGFRMCELDADAFANMEWRVRELFVSNCMDEATLIRLPWVVGVGDELPLLRCSGCFMRGRSTQADVPRIQQWLERVRWAADDEHIDITICKYDGVQHDLATSLSALRNVQFADAQTERNARLRLFDWPVTQDVLQALRAVPQWAGHIAMSLQWPSEPAACEALGRSLPVSTRSVELPRAPSAVIESVCKGLAERRAGLGLPPVKVRADELSSAHAFGPCVVLTQSYVHLYD